MLGSLFKVQDGRSLAPGVRARAIASRHKAAVEAWFAGELANKKIARPKEIARQVVLLVEGATSLILIHGDKRYTDAAAEAAKMLVKTYQFPR